MTISDTNIQTSQQVRYGPNSPFDPDEREMIEAICARLARSTRDEAPNLLAAIRQQIVSLEWFGEITAQYPSPLNDQRLGKRRRGLASLVKSLSKATPANFEFLLPTRTHLGRALVMAEANFYRLLRYVCIDIFEGDDGQDLQESTVAYLRRCLYIKLIEEVLSDIATGGTVDTRTRSRAVAALAQVWERRVTFRVSDFFPILDAAWNARRRITAIGGTLLGTHEMFELFKAGCDPEFVDFFARSDPSDDEVGAFREFLFGATTEDLHAKQKEMEEAGILSTELVDPIASTDPESATVFYEFFRSRHLQAMARRLANIPGPKHTAEAYVMMAYLDRLK
ncbi:MAG: hypothetical protein R3E58_07905 [Phycisphaerae bacterium]|nr:hypothetical protein [Phycisphaerales bacterium]